MNDQAYYDSVYAQQLAQYEKDRQLNNFVTLLQGLAAITVIVGFVLHFAKKG